MWYVFTLDSHNYYGPFKCRAHAQSWARAAKLTSYQIGLRLAWKAVVHAPWEIRHG